MAFVLPEDKKLKFRTLREFILSQESVDLKTLQRFAGKTTSFSIAVPATRLYTRASFRAISSGSKGLFLLARSTGLARFPRSRLASLSFVKILLCSYERPGWPGYRDLGFCDRDLGNRDENFLI